MNRRPGVPPSELEELRLLLLRREQQQLREIRARLEDKEARASDLSEVLPQAVRLSREHNGELSRALQPTVESSLREWIEKRPEVVIEALHPILGPMVRRSIAETLRVLLQSLNQTLEHTFSWRGLKWRYEAWRTGRPFAEVVLLHSLVYRVEQVFLIHRETSLAILHAAADPAQAKDSGMVAGMLSAIQDFARDSFAGGEGQTLDEFRMGDLQVWITPGRHAYLATVIRGNPARELALLLEDTIDNIHVEKGAALAKFDGDSVPFESLQPELEACLHTIYEPRATQAAVPVRAWIAIAAVAGVMIFGGVLAWQSELRWRNFVRRLNAEPGIAVTSAQHGWLGPSRIAGLRDPLAVDLLPLVQQAGLKDGSVSFEWKGYLALDAVSVLRRFEQRFGAPSGPQVGLDKGLLKISGPAPYEWLERVRKEAGQVPGILGLEEKEVTPIYDPALVLRRFENAFPPLQGLVAKYDGGRLQLSGMAPYEWLVRVRAGATKLPGIQSISEEGLRIIFDPKRVLERFTNEFTLPDTVHATLEGNKLTLTGGAAHAWLSRVRAEGAAVPGIAAIDDRLVVDFDQRTFQQTKTVIETAFVYFLPGKDNFATEGFAALSRLPEELRRCQEAGERLGHRIALEIRGSADAVGPEAKNLDLSQRRAHAVQAFLLQCGFEEAMLQPLGLGAASPAGTEAGKPAAEPSDRRVSFRIVTPP